MRLVRNYDLSPDLNEGLLLKRVWTGTPVMGMIEFLWGLSDGVNAAGLAVALAYGGRTEVAPGFGITTILRYVLETCSTVDEALVVLERVPSHMAYNVVLADSKGATVAVELSPGGGARLLKEAIATNHQRDIGHVGVGSFGRSQERLTHLRHLIDTRIEPESLSDAFLQAPLFQRGYADGFGTLFSSSRPAARARRGAAATISKNADVAPRWSRSTQRAARSSTARPAREKFPAWGPASCRSLRAGRASTA